MHVKTLCMLGNFCMIFFVCSFLKQTFQEHCQCGSNQAGKNDGPDVGPNCLQRLSADNKSSRQQTKLKKDFTHMQQVLFCQGADLIHTAGHRLFLLASRLNHNTRNKVNRPLITEGKLFPWINPDHFSF